jgi:hypothetical protein
MKHYPCAIISLLFGATLLSAAESNVPATADSQPESSVNDAAAQYQRARAYLRGEGVPKDPQKAFELMKAAADQGHAEAIGGLGYFYSVGVAVAKDEKQAIEWFRKGAEKGSAKAQFNLGKVLLDDKAAATVDSEKIRAEGLQWIQKAADQKLTEAALLYGEFLYFGDRGIEKDYDRAAHYFKIAADAGNPDAQNFLGTMSDFGWGVPADAAMAQQWFRKAALQGNLKAQSNLGRILGPLSESKETRIEALGWLLIASGQGEITAQKELQDNVPGLKSGEMDAANTMADELRKQIAPKKSRPN